MKPRKLSLKYTGRSVDREACLVQCWLGYVSIAVAEYVLSDVVLPGDQALLFGFVLVHVFSVAGESSIYV